MIMITIDDQKINIDNSKTVLQAALDAGIYIPHLCYHPQLDSFSNISSIKRIYQGGVAHDGEENEEFRGCNLCLVEIEGHEGILRSCVTMAEDGMSMHTDSPQLKRAREDSLAAILEKHPHACLLCPQGNGCDLKACSVHIPEGHRCCFKFGICELQKVAEYIGMERGLPLIYPLSSQCLKMNLLYEGITTFVLGAFGV